LAEGRSLIHFFTKEIVNGERIGFIITILKVESNKGHGRIGIKLNRFVIRIRQRNAPRLASQLGGYQKENT
jgi:hypothetical protein